MANLTMVYATEEGQTRKIVEFIAEEARKEGHNVSVLDVASPLTEDPPPTYDGLLVASAVHAGRHEGEAERFIVRHLDLLQSRPSAFLSVSLGAAKTERLPDVREGVETFLEGTGWSPDLVDFIAGALRYTKYGAAKRWLMKRIAAKEGLPTDTSTDHEFTDWSEVQAFARRFVRLVEGHQDRAESRPSA